MDWFDKAVALAWLALTYQQNRILRAGNPPQEGERKASQWHTWLVPLGHYWPTLMGIIVIAVILLRPLLVPRPVQESIIHPTATISLQTPPKVEGRRVIIPPRELSFNQTMALVAAIGNVKRIYDSLPPPTRGNYTTRECDLEITSSETNALFRESLKRIAQVMGCVVNQPQGPNPTDADATPTPSPEPNRFIVIRAVPAPEGTPPAPDLYDPQRILWERKIAASNAADDLLNDFGHMNIATKRSKKLKPGDNSTQVYIELGSAPLPR
jgi:hypothetical protein